ncbi:uncharacterized protein LOC142532253 [Primulina tabacum]|uniref:uncharacterized protein LOC142532253 n=1 Tax=Primulina tabacum TaxID=48773 RepID=UPI003F59A03A
MASYEALYRRKYRSPIHWDKVGERATLGPEIVQQTAKMVAKIQEIMKTTQSRHKSYADKRRRDLEFAAGVYNVFHISMLRKYLSNPSHVLNFEQLQLTPNLSDEEKPTQILGRQERKFRNKVIKMVKVKWLNHPEEEATWETETEIRSRYPELFGTS